MFVLGMEWLSSLGEIQANFNDRTLKVPTKEGTKILRGEPTLSRANAFFKATLKALQNDSQGFLIEYIRCRWRKTLLWLSYHGLKKF
jgi:hypothetical protein